MSPTKSRTVVIGAGISGLTAAAYLLRGGHEVLLIEKTSRIGGHVASFCREGFVFDAGPRALGNAGILRPMLEDLGIDLPLARSEVSTGTGPCMVHHLDGHACQEYLDSLLRLFPASARDIARIGRYMRSRIRMVNNLNQVPNPLFFPLARHPLAFLIRFLPRLPGFLAALVRTALADEAMETALARLTSNPALQDMVIQHFFRGTPASFALGYLANLQDYLYPLGGTGNFPEALGKWISAAGGKVLTDTEIVRIDPARKVLVDQSGEEYPWDHLVWCGDLNSLHARTDSSGLSPRTRQKILAEKEKFARLEAGESVFSVFAAVDLPPSWFAARSRGHLIYTPSPEGLGERGRSEVRRIKQDFAHLSREEVHRWLEDFCRYNSFEISIPVLRDASLAPENRTGLVISLLVDGELFELVDRAGWYGEFKEKMADCMLAVLEESLYPGLGKHVLFRETASPLTLMKRFGTTHGAITGWSMEGPIPVPHSLGGIMATARTAIPGVWKAGQWTYSPSGVPIAVLTGRVAAGAVLRAGRST